MTTRPIPRLPDLHQLRWLPPPREIAPDPDTKTTTPYVAANRARTLLQELHAAVAKVVADDNATDKRKWELVAGLVRDAQGPTTRELGDLLGSVDKLRDRLGGVVVTNRRKWESELTPLQTSMVAAHAADFAVRLVHPTKSKATLAALDRAIENGDLLTLAAFAGLSPAAGFETVAQRAGNAIDDKLAPEAAPRYRRYIEESGQLSEDFDEIKLGFRVVADEPASLFEHATPTRQLERAFSSTASRTVQPREKPAVPAGGTPMERMAAALTASVGGGSGNDGGNAA